MMTKQIIRFGLLSGLIFVAWLVIVFGNLDTSKAESTATGAVIGYSVMVLAFTVSMVLALMAYRRDNPGSGLWKGLWLCLGITGIASVIYVIGWALTYKFLVPDFKEWWLMCLDKQHAEGMINAGQLKEYKEMMVNYDNPVNFTLYTFVEVLPLGVLLSLIIAPVFHYLRKRKEGAKAG